MLVLFEIALTLVLLVAAGLLLNSFIRLQRVDPGFRTDQVTLISLPLPQSRYPDGKRQAAFYRQVLEAIERHREIQSAAILFPNPIEGRNANGTFTIEGQPGTKRADRPFTALASVSARLLPDARHPDHARPRISPTAIAIPRLLSPS